MRLLSIITIALFALTGQAMAAQVCTITEPLRVSSLPNIPNTKDKIVGDLNEGDVVYILDTYKSWVFVEGDGLKPTDGGWIFRSQVTCSTK